jgi:hypothetical protein
MAEKFKHPLARGVSLRPVVSLDGTERPILVVVTTLQLDSSREGYKKSFVEKLSSAVREHLARVPNVKEFVLVNRVREWRA